LKRTLKRHIALILLLAGYGGALLSYALLLLFEPVLGAFDWRLWLLAGSFIFLVSIVFFFAGPFFAIHALRAHRWLKVNIFDKSIDPDSFLPLEISVTCIALNFALFTIAFFLPLRELLVALLPPLQTIAELIPGSYEQVAGINFIWLFVPVAIAPTIVYALRWLRRESSERGETVIEILQVVFYVSLALPFIVVLNPSSFSGSSLRLYLNILGVILLPGSIGGVGVLVVLQEMGKKPSYIT
jgi:hypothetical protein